MARPKEPAAPGEPAALAPPVWRTARGQVVIDRPILVGILNVTPDSFSDGGQYAAVAAALAHAERLVTEGATIIDVGGESTRPGRTATVPLDEERQRVVPVIDALARAHPDLLISINTVKADVARAALDAGAAIVNDVTAFRHDDAMPAVVAAANAGVILMHSRGTLLDIASYEHAAYGDDVAGAVTGELESAVAKAAEAGIPADAVVLDPGFGFSKTVEQNLRLLHQLTTLQALGRPLLVGPSRKRFLGEVVDLPIDQRDRITAVACALAYERGARLFRVHDIGAAREALTLARAVRGDS